MHKGKKFISIFLLTVMAFTSLVSIIPQEILASRNEGGVNPGGDGGSITPPPKPDTGGGNNGGSGNSGGGNSKGGSVTTVKGPNRDVYVYFNLKDPNFRTMQVLDVANIVNDNVESGADYRPNLEMFNYLETLPEFNLADIKEYTYMSENTDRIQRAQVPSLTDQREITRDTINRTKQTIASVSGVNVSQVTDAQAIKSLNGTGQMNDKYKLHANKLSYLISKNIMSRDSIYVVNENGAYISPDKFKLGEQNGIPNNVKTKNKEQKYERPDELISKTDFIMELLKTEKVLMSPPIITKSGYQRVNNKNEVEFLDRELLETSPYQKYMGEVGIDTGATDVIADHKLFGRMSVMVTSSIPEMYLVKAYEKGMINLEDINTTTTEGQELLQYIKDGKVTTFADKENLPPRWAITEDPIRRHYSTNSPTGKIWESDNLKDGQYPEKIKEYDTILKTRMKSGYHQFDPDTKLWGNSFTYTGNASGSQLADWTMKDNLTITKRKPSLLVPKGQDGYAYLKNENISLSEAYVIIYNHLQALEGEKVLSEEEVDYLNSAYAMNMTSMTANERKAVQYLMAKGIINGNNKELHKSMHLPLSNSDAVELLWLIMKPEERNKIIPMLSETDKQMLKKGYSQVTLNINTNSNEKLPKAWIDVPMDTETIEPNFKGNDILSIFNNYTAHERSSYDIVFIRMPLPQDGDNNINLKLVINDRYRTELAPYAVFNNKVDDTGRVWKAYMVHKETNKDLMLMGTSDKHVYTINGIQGEGFYWIEDDNTEGKANKWTVDEFLNKPTVKSIIDKDGGNNGLYEQMKMVVSMKGQDVVEKETDKFLAQFRDNLIGSVSMLVASVTNTDDISKPYIADYVRKDIDNRTKLIKEIYAAPTPDNQMKGKPKDIIHGPYTESAMGKVKYGDDFLFISSGNGQFTINTNNKVLQSDFSTGAGSAEAEMLDKIKVEKKDGKFYLRATPKSFSYDVELARFLSRITSGTQTGGEQIPSYAQMTDRNGEPLVLISKPELERLGLKAVTDKLLENPLTGQRAFINTDDNYTLIGNNVTHYTSNDILVNAFGTSTDNHNIEGGEADKVYYNLGVVLELLNTSDLAVQSAGKNIDIKINGQEKFATALVRDAENKMADGSLSIIDKTYILEDGSNNKQYLNLSALAGPTTNFIYYKDKSSANPVEALIVYKPKAGYNPYTGKIDNTIDAQVGSTGDKQNTGTNRHQNNIPFSTGAPTGNSKAEEDMRKLKGKIISQLFIGSNADENFIGDDYIYNIYVLSRENSDEAKKVAQDTFLAKIGGTSKEVFDQIKGYTKVKPGGKSEFSNNEAELTINVLAVATSTEQNSDLLEHTGTGNLYMYMGTPGKQDTISKQGKTYRNMFYQNMYLDTTKKPYNLLFRQKHYFVNTPDNMIPLEKYAEHTGSYGSMFLHGGSKMINFKTAPNQGKDLKNYYKYRLPSDADGYNSTNNVSITSKTNKAGLFTRLEMPWVELKIDEELTGIDKDGNEIKFKLTDAKDNATLSKYLYYYTVKVFQDEINKDVGINVENNPVGTFDGDLVNIPKYNLPNVMKHSAVGYVENDVNLIRNLMAGSWDGFQGRGGMSKYNLSKTGTTEGMEVVKTMPDDKLVALGVGVSNLGYISKDEGLANGELAAVNVGRSGSPKSVDYLIKDTDYKVVKSGGELKTFAEGKKIVYKPSMSIPFGSTIVGRNGELIMRPADKPRDEVMYASNIINSMLLRMQLTNDYGNKIFLSDVEAGSVISLGDGKYIMKTSPKQIRSNNIPLQWVNVATLPDGNTGTYNKHQMTNIMFLSIFLSEWGNKIQIPYDIAGASVPFKSIVGKGVYTLPTVASLNKAGQNSKDGKAKEHITGEIWGKVDEGEGSRNYEAERLRLLNKQSKVFNLAKTNDSGEVAMPVLEITLPPTIALKEVTDPEISHHYEIEMYHDIKGFNVDKDNSYIQYLRDRDTNAEEILEGLELLRTGNLNGMKYRDYALESSLVQKTIKFINLLGNVLPLIFMLIIVLMIAVWVITRMPIARSIVRNFADRMGMNRLLESLDYGALSPDYNISFGKVFIVGVMLAFLSIIMMTGIFQEVLIKIILWFSDMFKK